MIPNFKIMSLDPGGTTGVCILTHEDLWRFTVYQIGPGPHHAELWRTICVEMPDILVCENFLYQRRPMEKGVGVEIISREYIGIAKLFCEIHEDETKFVLHPPSHMKFWTDEKLKKVYCYTTGKPHANDAMRHALYYTTFTMGEKYWLKKLEI